MTARAWPKRTDQYGDEVPVMDLILPDGSLIKTDAEADEQIRKRRWYDAGDPGRAILLCTYENDDLLGEDSPEDAGIDLETDELGLVQHVLLRYEEDADGGVRFFHA